MMTEKMLFLWHKKNNIRQKNDILTQKKILLWRKKNDIRKKKDIIVTHKDDIIVVQKDDIVVAQKDDMIHKYDIINYLIQKYKFKTYLELSTPSTGLCFDMVTTDIEKDIFYYSVDQVTLRIDVNEFVPLTMSEHETRIMETNKKYDIILVDSYHTFEQSKKDIENAYKLIADNGIIVIHDCYPKKKEIVSEVFIEGEWCGATYRAFIDFQNNNKFALTYLVDCDYGCGIIVKNKSRDTAYQLPGECAFNDIDFDYFIKNADKLLNIISYEKFLEIFT